MSKLYMVGGWYNKRTRLLYGVPILYKLYDAGGVEQEFVLGCDRPTCQHCSGMQLMRFFYLRWPSICRLNIYNAINGN